LTDADTYRNNKIASYMSLIYHQSVRHICLLLIATLSYILSIEVVAYLLEVC